MNQKINFWILQILAILLLGCYQSNSPEEVLQETKKKLSNASTIRYKYKSKTDNKFNETKDSNSAEIVYTKIENSPQGFGLHVISKNEEYLFDGFTFEKLKHLDKIRVVFEKDEIRKDSTYFYNFSFFSTNPIRIKEYSKFSVVNESIIDGRSFYIYKDEIQNKSNSDSTQIVKYQKRFFIDKISKDISQIQDLTIRTDDTLQIVDHYFSDYVYENMIQTFPKFDQNNMTAYKTIKAEDEYEEFTYTPIQEGAILSKRAYKDINQKEVNIYGEPTKSSLIMFSFIGCTPCEQALNDFKKSGYSFTDKINIYYSSFQNTSSSLKKYLKRKEFPYKAFGKESNMIEEFSLYHSPSFVLIDSNGKIKKVIEGYNDEVKNILLEMLKPN